MALGRILHAITFTDDVSTANSATQLYGLGTLRMEETSLTTGGEWFRYIQYNQGTHSVAAAANAIAYRGKIQGQPWVVTTDIRDACIGTGGLAAGVLMFAMTSGNFGWMKTKGFVLSLSKLKGSALNWAKGNVLIAAAATSQAGMAKLFKSASNGGSKVSAAELKGALQRVVGWAATAATSQATTGAAYIDLD